MIIRNPFYLYVLCSHYEKKYMAFFQRLLHIAICITTHHSVISQISIVPFQGGVAFYIETSHLFCSAKQMTDFYTKCNTGGNISTRC